VSRARNAWRWLATPTPTTILLVYWPAFAVTVLVVTVALFCG
jgi:hypothetical protein